VGTINVAFRSTLPRYLDAIITASGCCIFMLTVYHTPLRTFRYYKGVYSSYGISAGS
jgi:hypothetical protein